MVSQGAALAYIMLLKIEIHALSHGHGGIGVGCTVVPGIKVDNLPVFVESGPAVVVSTIAEHAAFDVIKYIAIPAQVERFIEAGKVFVQQARLRRPVLAELA